MRITITYLNSYEINLTSQHYCILLDCTRKNLFATLLGNINNQVLDDLWQRRTLSWLLKKDHADINQLLRDINIFAENIIDNYTTTRDEFNNLVGEYNEEAKENIANIGLVIAVSNLVYG